LSSELGNSYQFYSFVSTTKTHRNQLFLNNIDVLLLQICFPTCHAFVLCLNSDYFQLKCYLVNCESMTGLAMRKATIDPTVY